MLSLKAESAAVRASFATGRTNQVPVRKITEAEREARREAFQAERAREAAEREARRAGAVAAREAAIASALSAPALED